MGFVVVCLLLVAIALCAGAFSVWQLVRPLPCPFCDHTYRLGHLGKHWATSYCQEAQSKLTVMERYRRLALMS